MNKYQAEQNKYFAELESNGKVGQALALIFKYGSVDGEQHQRWVLDQVLRILTDCPNIEQLKVLRDGTSFTYKTLGESADYKKFCEISRYGENGPTTYAEWDTGIAP